MKPFLVLLAALCILAAGCIAPPDGTPSAGERTPNAGGEMTAKESREDKAGPCQPAVILGGSGAFCAETTIKVEGTLTGIDGMDVDLHTFNGNVELTGGADGAWSLVAVLRARGATEADAKASLAKIAFDWSHVDGDTHFLAAEAETPSPSGDRAASIAVTLPRSVALATVLATSNGNVVAKDVRTDGVSAHSSNGDVVVEADVTQADLGTSNGNVDATLRPWGSGQIAATTSNGAIRLKLPEDARHGYDAHGLTSNGKVAINLRDGEVERTGPSNPYYDPQNDARFVTNGFGSREFQTAVRLTTSNGGITVDPL